MRTTLTILGRSLFLACSWTWVIGMFFPVLLVRDFGAWSFVPFALFNVCGAMSVGLVLSAKGAAEAAYGRDLGARSLFSVATIAFHVFFVAGMAGRYLPDILGHIPKVGEGEGQLRIDSLESVAIVTILLLMLPYAVARKERSGWVRLSLAFVVFAVSLACAGLAYITAGDGQAYGRPLATGDFGGLELAFTSTGIAFGFLLCPYLDQSIVRIRSITPGGQGKLVSVLGFGVFFLAMILFTLAYSAAFLGRAWLSYYFLVHILAQSLFTVGVHMGELRRLAERNERVPRRGLFWGTLLACFLASGVGLFTHPEGGNLPMERSFTFAYQAFLSLYGVAFPLYVWALMVPVPGLRGRSRRARMRGFWAGLIVSGGPFAWGFLGHVWWLVAVGVGVALLTPLIVASLSAKTPDMQAETGDRA